MEHRCHFAAANHVSVIRRCQYAASKPVLDDPVGILHKTMTRNHENK